MNTTGDLSRASRSPAVWYCISTPVDRRSVFGADTSLMQGVRAEIGRDRHPGRAVVAGSAGPQRNPLANPIQSNTSHRRPWFCGTI